MADLYDGWYTNGRLAYLSEESKRHNAANVVQHLQSYGWTPNAIAGVLGNIEIESRFNPHCLDGDLLEGSYGLVQWHKPPKYVDWATEQGLDYQSGWSQCKRIIWEWQNNKQWEFEGMTFAEYVVSTDTPENLAEKWRYHYERSDPGTKEERQAYARKWYDYFQEHPVRKPIPIWLLFKMRERRREHARTARNGQLY